MVFIKRILRFRIRTILILMVMCATMFAFFNWRISWYREQNKLAEEIRKHAVHVEMQPGTPVWLRPLAPQNSFSSLKAVSYQNRKQLTDDDLKVFHNTPDLKVLSLHGTRITDEGLKHLSGLKSLDTLSLKFTSISDDGLAHLAGLTNLVKLQLSDSKVSGIGLRHLAKMKKLQHLELRNLEIIDEDIQHLEPLQDLRTLQIETRNLHGTGLSSINKLSKLRNISVKCYELRDLDLRDLHQLETAVFSSGEWDNIQVENCSKLTNLLFSETNSQHTLHTQVALKHLPALNKLQLPDLTDLEMNSLNSLEQLSLMNSNMNSLALGDLPKLKNLFLLNLSLPDNALQSVPQLPNLESIHLRNLRELDEEGIEQPTPPAAISSLGKNPNVTQLKLELQTNTNEFLRQMQGFPKLDYLELRYSGVTGNALSELPCAKRLSQLVITQGKLDGPTFSAYADGQLKSLILQDCSVDDECMSTISQLSKLTQLRLVKSSIHDHHLRHLTHLYELKYLCLAHNEVTDNGIQHLLCLPQLSYQSYDLFATKVSNEMKAILPGR